MRMWVVVVSLFGCVGDQLVPCGELLCPADAVCQAGVCATSDQLSQCDGRSDGTECDAVLNGTCSSGVCQSSICGDGIIGPEEVCDDSNLNSGDGCSLDCRSDETCGNGYPDFATDEQCDVGAGLSGDGCSSTCVLEVGLWRDVTMTEHGATNSASLVFDPRLGRLVMTSTLRTGETWEWRGGRMNRSSTESYLPRGELVFDVERGRTLLVSNGVHAWDGVTWSELSTIGPSVRAAAYDIERRQVIAWTETETWAWNGSWTKLLPTRQPPPTEGAMAYDATRKRVVWFGGTTTPQTWLWDGINWTQATPATTPTARRQHRMTWDPSTNTVVLLGGVRGTGATDATLWRWNGTNWIASATGSPALWSQAMAFDSAVNRLVVFGGTDDAYTTDHLGDEWQFAGGAWSRVFPDVAMPNTPSAMVYDAARARLVLIGYSPLDAEHQAWWRDGSIWHRLVSFDAGTTSVAAYHDARKSIFVWAPEGFWEITGDQIVELPAPPGVSRGALVYDPKRDVVVLFATGRTLTWDGSTWTETTNPLASDSPISAVYDRRLERAVVLHVQTFWEFDGTSWAGSALASSVHLETAMVYDGVRGVSVLRTRDGDYVDWNGDELVERESATPGPTAHGSLAYDGMRRELVEVVGSNSEPWTKRTWTYRMESKLRESCHAVADDDLDGLQGCDDPDCWAVCRPNCSPMSATCSAGPHCGDGECGGPETYVTCPSDCSMP